MSKIIDFVEKRNEKIHKELVTEINNVSDENFTTEERVENIKHKLNRIDQKLGTPEEFLDRLMKGKKDEMSNL